MARFIQKQLSLFFVVNLYYKTRITYPSLPCVNLCTKHFLSVTITTSLLTIAPLLEVLFFSTKFSHKEQQYFLGKNGTNNAQV